MTCKLPSKLILLQNQAEKIIIIELTQSFIILSTSLRFRKILVKKTYKTIIQYRSLSLREKSDSIFKKESLQIKRIDHLLR
jgi:hypothetical protein